jgi:hypothetical protein
MLIFTDIKVALRDRRPYQRDAEREGWGTGISTILNENPLADVVSR